MLKEILGNMRKQVRLLLDDGRFIETALHIEEWGRLFAYFLERSQQDVVWKLENDVQMAHDAQQKSRDLYEARISELEQFYDAQEQKSKAEIEELTMQSKALFRERNQLHEELHVKLQEQCRDAHFHSARHTAAIYRR